MEREILPRNARGRFRRWRLGERPDRVVLGIVPVWVRPGGLTGDPADVVAVFAPKRAAW